MRGERFLFYCTPVVLQQNWEVREHSLEVASRSTPEEPTPEEWEAWIREVFFDCVVYKFFDLGELSFCPDITLERRWKDLFGKRGILQFFCPKFSTEKWEDSWLSVEAHSLRYLYQAEEILQRAAKTFPLKVSRCFWDALRYRWGTDFLQEFQMSLGFSLWHSGVVAESGTTLSKWYGPAAKRMIYIDD